MATPMLNEAQIQRLWDEMLSSEVRSLYFSELATRYNFLHRLNVWSTFVLSSGAFATIVTNFDPKWQATFAIGAVVLSGLTLAMQFQRRAVDATELSYRWNDIFARYQAIWEDVYGEDAHRRLRKTDDLAAEASRIAHQLPSSRRRLSKWQKYVVERWDVRTKATAHAA